MIFTGLNTIVRPNWCRGNKRDLSPEEAGEIDRRSMTESTLEEYFSHFELELSEDQFDSSALKRGVKKCNGHDVRYRKRYIPSSPPLLSLQDGWGGP